MKNYSTFRLRTNFSNCALFAFLLIGVLTSHGKSQTTTSASSESVKQSNGFILPTRPTPFETTGTSTEKGAVIRLGEASNDPVPFDDECAGNATCIVNKLKSLKLNIPARIARGFQYQIELTEQPETVLVAFERDGEQRTGAIRNPQEHLQRHTFSFKFSELFPDRLSIFKRGMNYRNADAAVAKFLCGNDPLITCLTKGGGWFKRILMGSSLEFSLGERPLVKDQLFVPAPQFGKEYQPHGGFVLDFAKVFPNASDWKKTFDDVQSVDKGLALLGASDVLKGQKPWKHSLAFLLPKVEFKILSQFDFVKYNGAFVEPPFPERALNTWKFTWDLTRLIPDTKNRLDEDAIILALNDLKNTLGLEPPKKQCILNFSNEDRIVDVKRGFSVESCQDLAKHFNPITYQLSCVSKDGDDKSPKSPPSVGVGKPPVNKCGW